MSRVHILSVGAGDCTIIEHNSDRITMIDICGGNKKVDKVAKLFEAAEKPKGDFAMCQDPTNPIDYLTNLGVSKIFRFILTHPDMDHLDGFKKLSDNFEILNIWDSGARKDKPDFEGSPYREEDWDEFVKYRDGKVSGVTVVTPKAGSRFSYANQKNGSVHDGLHISSPDKNIIDDANDNQEFNDASYIVTYWSQGGRILFPGDAQEESWKLATEEYPDKVEDCSFLLAPHHGRKSGNYEFLETVNPECTLLGCALSKDLAYYAWNNRNLYYFTQNQAGNTVLEISKNEIEVYIENEKYATEAGGNRYKTNDLGYYFLKSITN